MCDRIAQVHSHASRGGAHAHIDGAVRLMLVGSGCLKGVSCMEFEGCVGIVLKMWLQRLPLGRTPAQPYNSIIPSPPVEAQRQCW